MTLFWFLEEIFRTVSRSTVAKTENGVMCNLATASSSQSTTSTHTKWPHKHWKYHTIRPYLPKIPFPTLLSSNVIISLEMTTFHVYSNWISTSLCSGKEQFLWVCGWDVAWEWSKWYKESTSYAEALIALGKSLLVPLISIMLAPTKHFKCQKWLVKNMILAFAWSTSKSTYSAVEVKGKIYWLNAKFFPWKHKNGKSYPICPLNVLVPKPFK